MALDAPEKLISRREAIPTNIVHYRGRSLPARIDPEARITYVVEMMAAAFPAKEHHITLCLRDETDGLVTQNNLPSKVYNHENLKLAASPATEAVAVVHSLQNSAVRPSLDSSAALPEMGGTPLKLALFNLSKYIKEEDFAVEFMLRGGVKMLVDLVARVENPLSGNSLAYALQGMRGLLEFEAPWQDLGNIFVARILALLVSQAQPNVLRPATAIARKLVIGSSNGPSDRKGKGKAKAKGKEREHGEATFQFGFDRLYLALKDYGETLQDEHGGTGAEKAMRVLVHRLEGTGDLELVAQSLGFINACLRSAGQSDSKYYPELIAILERLSVRRYVTRLMPTCAGNVVESQILNFQARYAAILDHRRSKPIRPIIYPEQERMLDDIWQAGYLGEDDVLSTGHSHGPQGSRTPKSPKSPQHSSRGHAERRLEGWRRIGLGLAEESGLPITSESDLFRDVGALGLECLHWFALHEESFHNDVMEQLARPMERRCPIGAASAECVKILCEHYKISQAGHHAPSHFQLFLLNFFRLHHLVLKFFLRMWHESESRLDDFGRLSFLVRSQIRLSLADEWQKTWLNLEQDFLESDYRTIRDRQLEMLEKEDGMLARPGVRELKEKLQREAYEVMAEQRIHCMLQGAWFNAATVLVAGIQVTNKPNPARPLRFLCLSPNRKTIAWADFATRPNATPAYDSLRERIDLSNITTIRSRTGCAVKSLSPNLISKLSFSLMSQDLSLLDVDAVHSAQLAEWTDGLRVLRGEGGMAMKESASAIQMLTELSLKVRLLDITGDGIEVPEKVAVGPAPANVDFWFAR